MNKVSLSLLFIALLLAGCGQTGPLVQAAPESAPAQPTAPDQPGQ